MLHSCINREEPPRALSQILCFHLLSDQAMYLWASAGNAALTFYLAAAGSSFLYHGAAYDVYSGPLTFAITSVAAPANFGSGSINGSVLQVQVIPEPTTSGFVAVAVLVLLGGAVVGRRRLSQRVRSSDQLERVSAEQRRRIRPQRKTSNFSFSRCAKPGPRPPRKKSPVF